MAGLYETPREQVLRLWKDMKAERDLYLPTWREIQTYVLPHSGRFTSPDDTTRGTTQMNAILNATASTALDTSSAGMASSLTNPARPWFRTTTADPGLAESPTVRPYLFQIDRLVQWVFARSNIHGVLVTLYRNAMAYGTASMWIDEDDVDIIRAYTFPIGQYGLLASARQRLDTVGREFPMTVRQVVQRFGEGNISKRLARLVEQKQWNQTVQILHVVCPNDDIDISALDGREKPHASVWMEASGDENPAFLRTVGYRQFPIMVGRWELNGTDDVWGIGPMHRALPDVKQLQHTEQQKLNLLDLLVSPPLNHPANVRGDFPSIMAGALNPVPGGDNSAKTEPTYAPQYQALEVAGMQCRELEQRIKEILHVDLWKMLLQRQDEANQRPPGMTATEVAERHEEKLILLGPTVDRFHNDVLGPLIKRTISILADRRMLPPPPDDLVQALVRGEDVKIEYLSILAQAQRLLGLGAMERFSSIALTLARTDPTVLDKIDQDEFLDQSADMLGIPPAVVRDDEAVAEMRISRARQQRAMMESQQMAQQAQAARNLGQTPVSGDTALSRLLQQYGPTAVGTQAGGLPQ